VVPPDTCDNDGDCDFSIDSKKQLCWFDGCNKRCTTPGDNRTVVPAGSPCIDYLQAMNTYYLGGAMPTRLVLENYERLRQEGKQNFDANNCADFQFPRNFILPSPPRPSSRPVVLPAPPRCPAIRSTLNACSLASKTCSTDTDCGLSYDTNKQQLCCSDGCNMICTTPGDFRQIVPENSACIKLLEDSRRNYRGGAQPTTVMIEHMAKLREDARQEFVRQGCEEFQYPQVPVVPEQLAMALGEPSNVFSENTAQNGTPGWVVAMIVLLSITLVALVVVHVKLWRVLKNN